MFRRVLIANRGEIALRVMRACHELGIETVVVHSEADRGSLYLDFADRTICIGPAAASAGYLNIPQIIAAAEVGNVDAIHPGYGFLAENAQFAEICESSAITFIGPTPDSMRIMGDKARARSMARECGVPVIPGSNSLVTGPDEAVEIARSIGYPVIIKAAMGGGGRGLRVAHNDISLRTGLDSAQSEAQAAFSDASVYLEKYIERPRHIEVQIACDRHGNRVSLGERECSLQRRHQKLVEESPAPGISAEIRKHLSDCALKIAGEAGYTNVGTVEFLMDADGSFYFIEMNTRIQVEHPVTEEVTGIDIVKEQILVAAGRRLSFAQEDVRLDGCAIECRINAEDPAEGFRANPGTITRFFVPGGGGVRVDSYLHAGAVITPFYDSLIAKLIVHRRNRHEAIATMERALREFTIGGIKTTIPVLKQIFADGRFRRGAVDTHFVESLLS